jgi:uncharacterized membrane protein
MLLLLAGLLLFILLHLVPTQPELRGSLVARLGEGPYKGLFSLLSLAALVLIVLGYHKLQLTPGKNPQLFNPPVWSRHLAFALMLPAFILLVAAYAPSRIRRFVQHPMLTAVKTWAAAHLLANGDLASVILFGSFLAYAVYDRISAGRRKATGPFGDRPTHLVGDVIAVGVGTALWAFMLGWGHAWIIGVPLLPA